MFSSGNFEFPWILYFFSDPKPTAHFVHFVLTPKFLNSESSLSTTRTSTATSPRGDPPPRLSSSAAAAAAAAAARLVSGGQLGERRMADSTVA